MIWWHEDYLTYDANGDGIAELLYIRRTGDFHIFSIEEMEDADDHPFEDWCPFPMQHRRIGQSLADKVMDLERINTVLLRQSFDGIYLSNNPRTYVPEESIGETTIEDLLTVRAGGLIRYKGPNSPAERQGAFDASVGFSALEYLERKRESRTGITRLNQGLDEETLNATARGQAQLIQKGEQMEEYVARNFANALAKLITKKAKLLRRYGQPITVPIDGEYVEVDPRQWPEDMIARVKVGLGASRKETRLAFRRELGAMQAAAMEAGLRIVDEKKLFNTAKGFIADAQLGDVSEYFNDPDQMPPAEPQPDPKMLEVQAKLQMEQAKHEGDMQMKAAELDGKQQESALKIQLAREEAAAKMELERQKAEAEILMNEQRLRAELEMKQREMEMREHLAARDAQRRDYESELKSNREGGSLAE
jgi:hypothetical protein